MLKLIIYNIMLGYFSSCLSNLRKTRTSYPYKNNLAFLIEKYASWHIFPVLNAIDFFLLFFYIILINLPL